MTNPRPTLDGLYKKVDEARDKAKAEGYVSPSGTYTFNNREGAAVSMALQLVALLLDGNSRTAFVLVTTLAQFGPDVPEILARIAKEILDKQCPPFIGKIADDFLREERETDKTLS